MNYLTFTKILTSCLVVAPKKDNRYYLNSVHFKQEHEKLIIECTDGSQMLRFTSSDLIGVNNFDFIIGREFVELLVMKIKTLGRDTREEIVELINFDSVEVDFGIEKISIIDAKYPNVDRVIWEGEGEISDYGVDAKLLSKIEKVARPFLNFKNVKLEFKDNLSPMKTSFKTSLDNIEVLMLTMPCRL